MKADDIVGSGEDTRQILAVDHIRGRPVLVRYRRIKTGVVYTCGYTTFASIAKGASDERGQTEKAANRRQKLRKSVVKDKK